jgi:hypothetical protein
MSIHEAHRLATRRGETTKWDKFVRAWNNLSEEEKGRALVVFRCPASGVK